MSVPSSPGHVTAAAPPSPASRYVQLAPGATAKIRGPIAVAIFSIITLGIYLIFWWSYVNREMADYGRARNTNELGDNPTKSTLALMPGALIVVPAIWTLVTTFQRAQAAQRLTGQTPINGWLGFVFRSPLAADPARRTHRPLRHPSAAHPPGRARVLCGRRRADRTPVGAPGSAGARRRCRTKAGHDVIHVGEPATAFREELP
jgi:hypothetical protein